MKESKFWNNGTLWKIIFALIAAAAAYGALTIRVEQTAKNCDQNTLAIIDAKQDIRELKTDIRYIRNSVDEIKQEIKTKK